jgi:hypothetical protein
MSENSIVLVLFSMREGFVVLLVQLLKLFKGFGAKIFTYLLFTRSMISMRWGHVHSSKFHGFGEVKFVRHRNILSMEIYLMKLRFVSDTF